MRKSGILLPIFSLSSDYGIGNLGEKAYEFVDFLKKAKQSYWQILPIGPTGYGDSPYQSFSSFAGNPYFIDIDELIFQGFITKEEVVSFDFGSDEKIIDYNKLFENRLNLLSLAAINFDKQNPEYQLFVKQEKFWLENYALFMAIKESNGMVSFQKWEDDVRLRKFAVINKLKEELKERIEFYSIVQFWFYEQWAKLKAYANENEIQIIGDIPIYVSPDSSELWADYKLFQVDQNRRMTRVAGCPPDDFSADGQLWGNPLYDWDYHIKTKFKWWKQRLRHCKKIYDVVRIDHFRGFESYYSIKANAKTARSGKWVKGPAYDFINMIKRDFRNYPIIAEDLGFLTKAVQDMLEYSGLSGMKVLQFAFYAESENSYLPHNCTKNSVVYTGTHDNATTEQWRKTLAKKDLKFAKEYLNVENNKDLTKAMVKSAMASACQTCIIPIQDYLNIGQEGRINVPGILGGNWQWRLSENELNKKLQKYIAKITKTYYR